MADRQVEDGNVASYFDTRSIFLTLNSTGTRDDINEFSSNDSLTGSKLERCWQGNTYYKAMRIFQSFHQHSYLRYP